MAAVVVYNEYISDKHHVHMNGTGAAPALAVRPASRDSASSIVRVVRNSYFLMRAPTEAS